MIWFFGILASLVSTWSNSSPCTGSSPSSEDETARLLSEHGQANGRIDYQTFLSTNSAQNHKTHNFSIPIEGSSKGKSDSKAEGPGVNPHGSRLNNECMQHDEDSSASTENNRVHSNTPSMSSTAPKLDHAPSSRKRLIDSHPPGSSVSILKTSSSSRDAVWGFITSCLQKGSEQCHAPSKLMIVGTTVLFGVFVAQVVAGVFSAKIASDRAGILASKHCGIWEFDDKAGEEAAYREDVLNNYGKESRASQYVKTCYDSSMASSLFSCGVFYNQSIAFDTLTNQPCPFASPDICLDGLYSAIKFDTGLIDASTIGVNTRDTNKFRRTTSCAPLNMSETYVKEASKGVNDTYHYYYGSKKDGSSYTFSTSGRPFEWLAPVYSVK